jgi:chromosomal replication initiator protein
MESTHTPPRPEGIELGSFDPQTPSAVWSECLAVIQKRLNNQSFKTWFEPIVPVSIDNGTFTIQVPSQFFSEWIEEHYFSLINEAIAAITGAEMTINYVVGEDDHQSSSHETQTDAEIIERGIIGPLSDSLPVNQPEPVDARLRVPIPHPRIDPTLNPRYTFENYIKGESNQFARAAAMAVAHNPGGTSFNPLVIYGGVGLGKTHLVYAIGNHVMQSDPSKRVLYVSSEKFTVDFVEAIQKDSVAEFSNYYRSVDLLIVDDIQFLAGK